MMILKGHSTAKPILLKERQNCLRHCWTSIRDGSRTVQIRDGGIVQLQYMALRPFITSVRPLLTEFVQGKSLQYLIYCFHHGYFMTESNEQAPQPTTPAPPAPTEGPAQPAQPAPHRSSPDEHRGNYPGMEKKL
jgi:hypothetical protein